MRYLTRSWLQPPPGPQEIDWANPLTDGLAFFAFPGDGGGLADLVDAKRISGPASHGCRVNGRSVSSAAIAAAATTELNFTANSFAYGATFFVAQVGVSSSILERGFWNYAQGNGGYGFFARADGRIHIKHHNNSADTDGGNSLYETLSAPYPTSYGISFSHAAGSNGAITVYRNGRFYRSDASFAHPHTAGASDLRIGGPATPTSCAWIYGRAVAPDTLAALTENPFQLLRPLHPRLIFARTSPGTPADVTVSPSGALGTAVAGGTAAIASLAALPAGGIAGIAMGSVLPRISVAVPPTGQALVASPGTVSLPAGDAVQAAGTIAAGVAGMVQSRSDLVLAAPGGAMASGLGLLDIGRSGWRLEPTAPDAWAARPAVQADWQAAGTASGTWSTTGE